MSDKWYVHRSSADAPAGLHVRNFPDEATAKRFAARLLSRRKKIISAGTLKGIRPAKHIDRKAVADWCKPAD